jgi:D-glycero-D-manno-heptose 1,7-bisphosphate phosphatase
MPMHRAVFLDRDGVINKDVDHLNKVEDLRLFPGTAKAIAKLNRAGFVVVVISNQAGVAKGILTAERHEEINAALLRRLARHGARVDAVQYCFHHPEAIIKKYRVKCLCRKPNPGMILAAARALKVDLRRSFLVGDKTVDILAGKRARLTTILVTTGYGGRDGLHDVAPDHVAKNLPEAVTLINRSR